MKIAIISDIHDNEKRLLGVFSICKKEKVSICICCGDISSLEIVSLLSKKFKKLYFSLGNMDFNLKNQINLFPENCVVSEDLLEIEVENLKIAIVHHDYRAKGLAKENIYDFIFYGHTHTPWEKKFGKTIILNPGEISGQYGKASFAIFDTKTRKALLKLLK